MYRSMSPASEIPVGPARPDRIGERTRLNIVRLALVLGVITFGAVAFAVQRASTSQIGTAATVAVFRALAIGLLALGAGALVVLRSRIGDVTDPAKQRTLCIVGYALCESPALAGGVIWMMGGGPLFYGLGLGLLIAAVTLLAPPSEDPS